MLKILRDQCQLILGQLVVAPNPSVVQTGPLPSVVRLERVDGIEPTIPLWKSGVLPLNYTRRDVGELRGRGRVVKLPFGVGRARTRGIGVVLYAGGGHK